MLKNQPSKDEILESIRDGVKEAFLEVTESRDFIRTEQIMKAIESGVFRSFPCFDESKIYDIIFDATRQAMISKD